jgi:hypothetical protein
VPFPRVTRLGVRVTAVNAHCMTFDSRGRPCLPERSDALCRRN